jgi:hypothetical protein
MDIDALQRELEAVVAEFGQRPYNFFTILAASGGGPVSLRTQNQRWEFIKSETWHSLNLVDYILWSVSDNGDLLWWNGDRIIAMDPRSSTFISEPVRPLQFIRLAGMGKLGQVFPALSSQ